MMRTFRNRLVDWGVVLAITATLGVAVERGEPFVMVAVGVVVTAVGIGVERRGWGVDQSTGAPNVLGRLSSQLWVPPVAWGICLMAMGIVAHLLAG